MRPDAPAPPTDRPGRPAPRPGDGERGAAAGAKRAPDDASSSSTMAVRAAQELLARSATSERLGPALRQLAEELALERRRTAALRSELERVRRRLAVAVERRGTRGGT